MSTRVSKLNHDERRERRKAMAEAIKSTKGSSADVILVARRHGVTPRTVRDACREFFVAVAPREYVKRGR